MSIGVVLGVATPARAGISGRVFVSEVSGEDSAAVKWAIVSCPAARR
ncbi:hypothetical protein ACFQX7_09320 [Luedemannella flava]